MEVKTGGGRLIIALSIFVRVANLSDWQQNKKLVMDWRKRLRQGRRINALFN